jgi:hypothetical protein
VGGCWGCFVPGEQSFGVLPGAENPDGTEPHEPPEDSMRIMVRRGSGVRVPASAWLKSTTSMYHGKRLIRTLRLTGFGEAQTLREPRLPRRRRCENPGSQ